MDVPFDDYEDPNLTAQQEAELQAITAQLEAVNWKLKKRTQGSDPPTADMTPDPSSKRKPTKRLPADNPCFREPFVPPEFIYVPVNTNHAVNTEDDIAAWMCEI